MCGRENDVFPRKFENCVVSTTIKPEQPGQNLRKPQEKSQCRQDGFLTVILNGVKSLTSACHNHKNKHVIISVSSCL